MTSWLDELYEGCNRARELDKENEDLKERIETLENRQDIYKDILETLIDRIDSFPIGFDELMGRRAYKLYTKLKDPNYTNIYYSKEDFDYEEEDYTEEDNE